ncbi:MAG TPA: hypothetical protein VKZ55_08765 [Microthrixaceae bacterium]|nr:hypothetical protein [Microthrixaceae bacterium]
MADPQDRAEALDSDKLVTSDDPDAEPEYPPDVLLGADDYGITAAEERVDEPLEERVDRESVDPLAAELDTGLDDEDLDELVSLEAELDAAERELELTTGDGLEAEDLRAAEEPGEVVGRIYEPGTDEDVTEFIDREGDSVGSEVPAEDLSAEEAAMHPTDDPPMGRPGGGYLD